MVGRATSSRPRSKPVACNDQVVKSYLAELNAALGDDPAFTALFDDIKRDKKVRQVEAIAIASAFVAPMPKSTAKGKALDSVRRRHQSLRSFQLKRGAASGGSIA
jgi:hypothetical protein